MSRVTSPPEKKRLAYERDHYPGGGEHDKGWRRAKPLKKARARRAFRKASNDLLRVCGEAPENAPANAVRKQAGIRQRRVEDRGPTSLREFVATRRVRNRLNVGAKKARRDRKAASAEKGASGAP